MPPHAYDVCGPPEDSPMLLPDCIAIRVCKTCGNVYPELVDYFHKSNRHRGGIMIECKHCDNAKRVAYTAINPDLHRARRQRYENKHPERIKDSKDRYYKDNREIVIDKASKRQKDDPEWARARNSKSKKRHPERRRAEGRKRRALLYSAEGYHTDNDEFEIGYSQGWKCYWCGRDCKEKHHADHLVPLSRGGSDWAYNIVIACVFCNCSRNNRILYEWKRFNG